MDRKNENYKGQHLGNSNRKKRRVGIRKGRGRG
jgi:hypothetical protein